ncbi:MAG: hypothetical protein J6P73_04690 [Bacteroidales bacterium]|nr:hypothetical protein [Bacteroidales bacterium]
MAIKKKELHLHLFYEDVQKGKKQVFPLAFDSDHRRFGAVDRLLAGIVFDGAKVSVPCWPAFSGGIFLQSISKHGS